MRAIGLLQGNGLVYSSNIVLW